MLQYFLNLIIASMSYKSIQKFPKRFIFDERCNMPTTDIHPPIADQQIVTGIRSAVLDSKDELTRLHENHWVIFVGLENDSSSCRINMRTGVAGDSLGKVHWTLHSYHKSTSELKGWVLKLEPGVTLGVIAS